ncbi:unnamed protein product, partial [marine sediment metagenome]
QKRRAPKNDEEWCNRFVQNSHGEPTGDKTDSGEVRKSQIKCCTESSA